MTDQIYKVIVSYVLLMYLTGTQHRVMVCVLFLSCKFDSLMLWCYLESVDDISVNLSALGHHSITMAVEE